MDANLKEAIRLLGIYSNHTYDIWVLAGRSRASSRAHVMSALAGKKTPQSKAGVNAIRQAFYALINPAGNCEAIRSKNFQQYCLETEALA